MEALVPCWLRKAGKGAGFLKLIQPDAVVPSKACSDGIFLPTLRAGRQVVGVLSALSFKISFEVDATVVLVHICRLIG